MTLHIGDVREVLPSLPAEAVQMCVTSPPYWGLRDYGTASWEGGDAECDHEPRLRPRASRDSGGLTGGKTTIDAGTVQRDCHCGARRIDSQLGLEATPEEYVANMVGVFREVRRVLKDDGTLWLNLGDSYAHNTATHPANNGTDPKMSTSARGRTAEVLGVEKARGSGLKPKDLVGIPWRVAFALQSDGWYLRSDIIWHKPNPMPESVTDRPTKAHEYLFLLTKNARYHYDADAIREPHTRIWDPVSLGGNLSSGTHKRNGKLREQDRETPLPNPLGRNRRSVWTVPTKPYSGAHFAVFPPALIEPCILAGSRPGDVVLDPFFGSGTTGEVCERLGRRWEGVELNAEYATLAHHRTAQMGMAI